MHDNITNYFLGFMIPKNRKKSTFMSQVINNLMSFKLKFYR